MFEVKQSTALDILFFAHDVNGDAVTGIADGSFGKNISKNGGVFAAMTVTITERAAGWYLLPLSAVHTDTLGVITIYLTSSAKQVNLQFRVAARITDDLATPTNITAGTITTATNVTTVNGLAANVITAAATAADFGTEVAAAVWQDAVAGDFTVASSIGKALYIANIAPGAAGGHLISGSNAGTTTFGALTVTGATTLTGNVALAAGLTVTQSTVNGHGVSITGNGTGHGILSTSGAGVTGDGLRAVAASTNGHGITGVKTGTGSDLNVTVTPMTLAKTTNITGFNDIAATAVVSAGAITTLSGAVVNVDTVGLCATTTTATNVTTVNGLAANVITAAATAADFSTEVRSLASGTSDSGTTTTMVDAARTEADTDYWKGCLIMFTSGTLLGQTRLITGFNFTTDTITFAPATTQAVGTHTYEILPDGRADLNSWLGTTANALAAGRVDASVGAMAVDTLTAAALAADAVTEIQAGLATPTNITAGTITTVTNLTNAATAGDLTATMKTSVKTQVTDGLNVDTYAEPGQAAPPATTTLVQKIGYLYKQFRNRKTQTATQFSLYNDDAVTVDQKSTVSDDGTTAERAEVASGP